MSEKQIILTVRATQDGVYGNYLYKGPITSDEGYTPGEVFQVDATPYPLLDHHGKAVFDLDEDGKKIQVFDAKGKAVLTEKGKLTFKIKMATFFSPTWMERVEDDTELTYPDRPKWTIPEAYRIKKNKPVRTVALPPELQPSMAIPESVNDAIGARTPQEVI
jgi:hypothetical protein